MGPALDRHVALVGFMGAGKTTVGAAVARELGRPFVDTDDAVVDETHRSIEELFEDGSFRAVEEHVVLRALEHATPAVIALGGGAVESALVRTWLDRFAFTVLLEVDVEEAWARAAQGGRPLARDEAAFRLLHAERGPVYGEAADAVARDAADVVLAAGAVHVAGGSLERLGELVPGKGPVGLVSDERVAGIYGAGVQLALGERLVSSHELPSGEEAKTLVIAERLWAALPLGRDGIVLALGGGCVTDCAGFVAATHLRGVPWVAVPTTLVGQVDAAIGGKTGLDLPQGKNLVGAFHWPVRTVIDPTVLATLPESERRAGLAEAVKTGLLAGERLWELPEPELVRRCAAFKTAVCMRDPTERGERAELNLGHTFAHALETASGYTLAHGDAVALGLLAALRLSGLPTDDVESVLRPQPVHVDRERARAALMRDKKVRDKRLRLVLLESPGRPLVTDAVPVEDVHSALDALIAG